MWDLIHDRTHSHGDLPFDPFMIKQRMPFWMYALEELRCDLTTFREAVRLEEQGVPYARLAQYAIVLDRLFRFPITGDRVRNYDGLGGQLLFAYLHRHDVAALDRQPAQPRLEAAARGRHRPRLRGGGALPRGHRPLPRGALDGVVRAGLALRPHPPELDLGQGQRRRCRWTGRPRA